MAKEIERKFLVRDDSFKAMATASSRIVQGYVSREPERTVRVRLRDGRGFLTLKGLTVGIERNEWEYAIPAEDAGHILATLCRGTAIDKTRWLVPYGGYTWEVDVFHNIRAFDGEGELVVAEVELPAADVEPPLPPFVGEEVSDNPAYFNSALIGRIDGGGVS